MCQGRFIRRFLPRLLLISLAPGIIASACADEDDARRSTHQLHSSVIGIAGSSGTSENFTSNGTLGQPTPIGVGTAADKTLYAGFWARLVTYYSDVGPPVHDVVETVLHQNAPNPFHSKTNIRYSLAEGGTVEIKLYDVIGREIKTMTKHHPTAGNYGMVWDGRGTAGVKVSAGIYFYQFKTRAYTTVRRMLVLN